MNNKCEIVRPRHIQAEFGISESTARRWAKEGRFPSPIKLGPRLSGWHRSSIKKWLDEKEST